MPSTTTVTTTTTTMVLILLVSTLVPILYCAADTISTNAALPKHKTNHATKNQNDFAVKHPHYDDIGANLDAHPNPNDEHYDHMIYVGRWHLDDHHEHVVHAATSGASRLGWDVDNAIKYVFGSSLDWNETHANTIADHDLHPEHYDNNNHHHDGELANRAHPVKTRDQVLQERRRHLDPADIAKNGGPKPFGHVETHSLDGGVTPPHVVRVDPFFLDVAPVTNAEFAKFVAATYYVTEAEQFGWSFVLTSFVPHHHDYGDDPNPSDVRVDPEAPAWVTIHDAHWRRPEGPKSTWKLREDHPVVHVSHRDAAEYCHWKGQRLPGEREWEAAARAGHWGKDNRTMYSWGNETDVATASRHANLWGAGEFPRVNHAEDGWRGTSPVQTYPANGLGFYDMTGNVWEWMRGGKHKSRIVRGGSFVDSIDGSTNHAATLGARDTIHGTTTTANVGFRCAKSPKRRQEYHYVDHDEQVHGQLAMEDQFGRRDQVPLRGWEDQFEVVESDDEEEEEKESERTRKKKVLKKRERLMTEL